MVCTSPPSWLCYDSWACRCTRIGQAWFPYKNRLVIKLCQPLSWLSLLYPIHVFGLPVALQGWLSSDLVKSLPEILHHVLSCCGYIATILSFKTGMQIRIIVPPAKSKQLYKGAPFPATPSAYLCKYGGCKKYKFHNSDLWWWHW